MELRSFLPEIDAPLQAIIRVPNRIVAVRGTAAGDELIQCLGVLTRRVDKALTRSWRRARPPTPWEQARLDQATKRVRAAWERQNPAPSA